jgi:hypothetical protein
MIAFETIALAYFVAMGAAAALALVPRAQRLRALAAAIAIAGTIGVASHLPITARLWLGHLYLVTGYWLPVLLVAPGHRSGAGRFESWLRDIDARLGWAPRSSRPPHLALELSYLLCYPLVPTAFLIVLTVGPADAASRFWSAVLVAGFACYGSLPWLVARPPRHFAVASEPSIRGRAVVRGTNEWVLRRGSHGMNTFPSGHVAVSVAAALEVLAVAPAAGAGMLIVAGGIAAGAAVGRYHYLVDVLLGVVVGVLAALVT